MEQQPENVKFGEYSDNDDANNASDTAETEQCDPSKYTMIDHLEEDSPIRGQEYCLFSFLSPEGIMNCNIRAVKFCGAYPTLEAAEQAAMELEKKDKYFKIFVGESGKWLDFDPPASRVEKEKSSNKEHQKILDAQRKQRMDKINALAGKHKENIDKKDGGKKERIDETKKSGAAMDAVEKRKSDKTEEKPAPIPRSTAIEKTKDRLRKRLAETKNKKQLQELAQQDAAAMTSTNIKTLDEKIKVVNNASIELEEKKALIEKADNNIANIKALLEKRREKKTI